MNMNSIKKVNASQSQKMMIFVLAMSLYGLSTLFTELIPKFQVGLVEFSVEYFLFIPLTLAMLFDPLYVALGAATGEVIFSEIMLGQFGGLGELEKFITLTIGIYIAGRMLKDPLNRKMVGIAAMTGVVLQQAMGCAVDILKVQFAIEGFEAVAGLPESVYFTEGFAFLNDVLFSGILFCLLPTLYLVPKLYGKIEPLLGLRPRTATSVITDGKIFTPKVVLLSIVGFFFATAFEFMAESGFSLIDWEASWAETPITFVVGFLIALLLVLVSFLKLRKQARE
jgi:hypothetical protein